MLSVLSFPVKKYKKAHQGRRTVVSPFESVTRVALREIIESHLKPSKFGYFLSEDSFEDLSDELFKFLQTSRNLKAAGDRFLSGAAAPEKKRRQPPY